MRESKANWISTKDRVPDSSRPVFIAWKGDRAHRVYMGCCRNKGNLWFPVRSMTPYGNPPDWWYDEPVHPEHNGGAK